MPVLVLPMLTWPINLIETLLPPPLGPLPFHPLHSSSAENLGFGNFF